MKIETLFMACVCAIASTSATLASTVLFSENWSEMEVGSKPVDSSNWKYWSSASTQPDPFDIQEKEVGSATKKILVSTQPNPSPYLAYLITENSYAYGNGVSLEVTLNMFNNPDQYVRLGFMPGANSVPNSSAQFYLVDIRSTNFNVARVTNNLSGNTSYASVGGTSPSGQFVTFTFQMFEEDSGLVLRLLNNGVEIWRGTDTTGEAIDFSSGVKILMGTRAGVNYFSDVNLTAIPEPSHFGLGFALLAAGGVVFMRRLRSRR